MFGKRLSDTQQTMNRTGAFVAAAMTLLLGFTIYAMIYEAIPEQNQNALLVLIGALTTNVTSIVSFYYGASSGTRQKDATIQTLSSTAATAQAALTPTVTTTTTTAATSSTSNVPPVVATVATPGIEVPLHAGQTATVKTDTPT
jgi:type IV secretory pathway VirB3-like protein